MKKILLVLALAGCQMTVLVSPEDIAAAMKVCEANGGLQRLEVRSDMTFLTAICKNEAIFKDITSGGKN